MLMPRYVSTELHWCLLDALEMLKPALVFFFFISCPRFYLEISSGPEGKERHQKCDLARQLSSRSPVCRPPMCSFQCITAFNPTLDSNRWIESATFLLL